MSWNGYRASHKNKWLLLEEKLISTEILIFWEFCLDKMIYDKRNLKSGTAEIDFDEVMRVFGVKSKTTVRTWYHGLLATGLATIENKARHVIRMTNPERYNNPPNGKPYDYEKAEYNQPVDVVLQSIGFLRQSLDSKSQLIDYSCKHLPEKSKTKALSSFKDEFKENNSSMVERELEFYHKQVKEMNFIGLSALDAKWISEKQFPQATVEDDLSDEFLAAVFFGGNMKQYELHLTRKYV